MPSVGIKLATLRLPFGTLTDYPATKLQRNTNYRIANSISVSE